MPSAALLHWQSQRAARLDRLRAAHTAIGGSGPAGSSWASSTARARTPTCRQAARTWISSAKPWKCWVRRRRRTWGCSARKAGSGSSTRKWTTTRSCTPTSAWPTSSSPPAACGSSTGRWRPRPRHGSSWPCSFSGSSAPAISPSKPRNGGMGRDRPEDPRRHNRAPRHGYDLAIWTGQWAAHRRSKWAPRPDQSFAARVRYRSCTTPFLNRRSSRSSRSVRMPVGSPGLPPPTMTGHMNSWHSSTSPA